MIIGKRPVPSMNHDMGHGRVTLKPEKGFMILTKWVVQPPPCAPLDTIVYVEYRKLLFNISKYPCFLDTKVFVGMAV